MRCQACGTQNEEGRKFCGECGLPLTVLCGACGTANAPGAKFCGECGTALAAPAGAPAASPAAALEPVAERRLVSILFADLVGFTTMSEARDAEDVRELLSRYFDTCRTLIARYGGTVEKFIGDAVMAVWGAPVAMEDDAERAVRAAIDLAAAVEALGERGRIRRPAGPCRGADRRGGGHDRRPRRGDGGRRPGEHRLADPVGGRARHGARRRVDQARDRGGAWSTRTPVPAS